MKMRSVNLRELAFEVLRRRGATPLRAIDRVARREGLEPRDRALLRRLITTEARRRGTLRALSQHFTARGISPDLSIHLRIGLAQLFFLDRIPDHAAVSETVSAAMATLGDRKGRIVNGVLRNALRVRATGSSGDPRRDIPLRDVHLTVPVFHDPREHPLLWMEEALSLPVALAKRWSKRYGEEQTRALASMALEEPDLSLRIAAFDTDRESILRELAEIGVEARASLHERIVLARAEDTERALRSDLFARGRISVQGETALRSAELVGARAGECILDACASPGGKTAVLAATGARVIACDVSAKKLARVRETLDRLAPESNAAERRQIVGSEIDGSERVRSEIEPREIGTTVRSSAQLAVCAAARAIADASCDAVLVDAPCSNTGVLAKRPEARWRFGNESQRSLGELQSILLREGARCVRRGGRLVYATCSIEPEENQRRVKSFLAQHAGFAIEDEIEALPAEPGSSGPVDGGYAVRLRRNA
jgi:16S rRNA (cytosine967-C5)-methyltransferase